MSAASLRRRIGIITGSGPEAGIDLWSKVLVANRRSFGDRFRGDLDAPEVSILSVPDLGLSMELERHHEEVWRHLEHAARTIGRMCDVYAIACNTLNYFEPRLMGLDSASTFLSFNACVSRHLWATGTSRVAVLGARPVMELGAWSHYAGLLGTVDLEVLSPGTIEAVHELIYAVKRDGAGAPANRERLTRVIESVNSDTVLLACTELPLIERPAVAKNVLDVTQLVADELVRQSLQPRD